MGIDKRSKKINKCAPLLHERVLSSVNADADMPLRRPLKVAVVNGAAVAVLAATKISGVACSSFVDIAVDGM